MVESTESLMDKMAEIQAGLLAYEPDLKQTMLINGQARYVTWDFSKVKIEQLELLQITDIQFGHKACDVEQLNKYLAWVLASPQRYIFLGGDLVDAGHRNSKGSPFEQIGDPQEEMWKLMEILAPVRHRILGYVGGNHERRTADTFGDLGRSIATIMQIPYSPGKQHIDIIFGKHRPFKTTLWHGGGSGQTKGALANSVYRLMVQGDSQLYLIGHLHQATIIPDWREVRDGKGGTKLIKIIGAMGTSFLKHYGTYAEVIMGTKAQGIMMARTVLEKSGHWEVTLR